MDEVKIATERKFEGAAWVADWGPFPSSGPANSGRMLTMQNSIKLAKEATPQQAFVFIKPHACTEKVIELVKAKFSEVGVSIISEGEIDGATIDEKKLIDQHCKRAWLVPDPALLRAFGAPPQHQHHHHVTAASVAASVATPVSPRHLLPCAQSL